MSGVISQTNKHVNPVVKLFTKISCLKNYWLYSIFITSCTYVHIADSMDVNVNSEAENLSIRNSAYQLNAVSTQCCVIDDEAPDDRANKCSLNNNGRRRLLALQDTTSDVQCKYVASYSYM